MEDLRRDGGALAAAVIFSSDGIGPALSRSPWLWVFKDGRRRCRNPQRSSSLIDERLHASVPSLCSRMSAEVQPVRSGSLPNPPPPPPPPLPALAC